MRCGRLLKATALSLVVALTGCAATQTLVSKRELDVQTKTSTAVFVDAVSKEKRTIYLDVKSGVMEFDRRAFKQFVKSQFEQNDNGYRIVDDPDTAQFQMVAYVLNLEETDPTAAEQALNKGYMGGSIVAGAAAGSIANSSSSYRGAVTGGILGGAAELVSGSFVKDVTYMLVCDVQIKELARKGVLVRKDSKVNVKVSDNGSSSQMYSEATRHKEYRTRIVTTANKANLELAEAQTLMFEKTAYAMSGFF